MEDMAIISLKNYDDALSAAKEKSGNPAPMTSAELGPRIRSIPTGTDTSDATATADEIFEGKTAYLKDGKATGTFTIESELANQATQIAALKEAVKGKGGTPPVIQPLVAKENKVYNPPAGVDGFSPVTVEVPTGGGGFPNGTKWTRVGIAGYHDNGIACGNGIWVLSGGSAPMWSSNGKTWGYGSGTTGTTSNPDYLDGLWVLCSNNGIYWSVDGKTWTIGDMGEPSATFYGVEHFGPTYACSSDKGLFWSANGKEWVQSNIKTGIFDRAPLFSNGVWVAAGRDGVYWSDSGREWTLGTDAKYYCNGGVENANGLWVIGSDKGLYWSEDGKNWTKGAFESNVDARRIHNANGIWVASTSAGVLWSEDGKNWEKSDLSASSYSTPAYANGVWLIGASEKMYLSTNGKNWKEVPGIQGGFSAGAVNANGIWVVGAGYPSTGLYYSVTWEPS